MLTFKASQLVNASSIVEKPYDMTSTGGQKGISVFSDLTVISTNGSVAIIRLKAPARRDGYDITMPERHKYVKEKLAAWPLGKPVEIPITGMEDGARGVMILNA